MNVKNDEHNVPQYVVTKILKLSFLGNCKNQYLKKCKVKPNQGNVFWNYVYYIHLKTQQEQHYPAYKCANVGKNNSYFMMNKYKIMWKIITVQTYSL